MTKGLTTFFPSKYHVNGKEFPTCKDKNGIQYWSSTECEKIILKYKTELGKPTPLIELSEKDKPEFTYCFRNNDPVEK